MCAACPLNAPIESRVLGPLRTGKTCHLGRNYSDMSQALLFPLSLSRMLNVVKYAGSTCWDSVRKLTSPDWQSPLWIAAICLRLLAEQTAAAEWPAPSAERWILCGFFAAAAAAVTDAVGQDALLALALQVLVMPLLYLSCCELPLRLLDSRPQTYAGRSFGAQDRVRVHVTAPMGSACCCCSSYVAPFSASCWFDPSCR